MKLLRNTALSLLLVSNLFASEPFIGEVKMFAGNFAPRGYALCDGQILSISQHTALFSLLGTTYGGDGRTTFGLPDLRGRTPIHAGTGPGLTQKRLGQKGGTETVTLTSQQMPSHKHALKATVMTATTTIAQDAMLATTPENPTGVQTYSSDSSDQVIMKDESIETSGGNQPHSNMPPYNTINYIIALTGIFPSRN